MQKEVNALNRKELEALMNKKRIKEMNHMNTASEEEAISSAVSDILENAEDYFATHQPVYSECDQQILREIGNVCFISDICACQILLPVVKKHFDTCEQLLNNLSDSGQAVKFCNEYELFSSAAAMLSSHLITFSGDAEQWIYEEFPLSFFESDPLCNYNDGVEAIKFLSDCMARALFLCNDAITAADKGKCSSISAIIVYLDGLCSDVIRQNWKPDCGYVSYKEK